MQWALAERLIESLPKVFEACDEFIRSSPKGSEACREFTRSLPKVLEACYEFTGSWPKGLNFLAVLGRRSEVVIKEVFKHHGPILGKVVEVT
ncbi:hypothetical protein B296_00039414 [Ensete ventricosum]|uniref:Uncharacterized protein n=1 Tax=Ensete ventricosum TaxID=4639 RepID=A0A426X1X7_ENSVE|nr:hypothetical protein B296_00039414 [Ensete ventricosum]